MAGQWRELNWRLTLVILGWAGAVACALIVSGLTGLRLNTSPSVPIGLYVITSSSRATLVQFCPDGPHAKLSKNRGYRPRGSCPDGAAPLLKQVVAREGDAIDFSASGIAVGGRLLPHTAPVQRDSKGRGLDHWPFGTYSVAPGTVWVASTRNPLSFDSRYFGPVDLKNVAHGLRPLWTFGH